MPALTCQVDHVVIAVSDLDDAVERWTGVGLPIVIGGEHPGGTANALVRGPRPAYVELITTLPRAEGPWADRVRAGSGLLSWALSVDDLEAAREAVIALGHSPAPIVEGARTTPDGETITWRMCEIGGPFDPQWPFLIEWRDAMPPGPATGPLIEGVTLHHPEPGRLARLLETLGIGPADSGWPDATMLADRRGVEVLITSREVYPRIALDVAEAPLPSPDAAPLEIELDGVILGPCAGLRSGSAAGLWAEVEVAHAAMGVEHWPAPYVGAVPAEAHERVTRPERYRTVTRRVTAWADTLERRGIAVASPLDPADLSGLAPGPEFTNGLRIVPTVAGAIPLTILSWMLEGCADAGVTIAAGAPPRELESVPDCGCDACDEGSAAWIARVDAAFLGVLAGGSVWERSSGTTTIRTAGGILTAADEDDAPDAEVVGRSWL